MNDRARTNGYECEARLHGKQRVWLSLCSLCVLVLAGAGCAQYTALNQPKRFKPTAAVVGADRGDVTAELGAPVVSTERNTNLTETYRYVDGGSKNSAGLKIGRSVLYTGGDLFTLWLDQLVTWPLEKYGFAGTSHVVTVNYAKAADGFWRVTDVCDVEQGKPQKPAKAAQNKEVTMTEKRPD